MTEKEEASHLAMEYLDNLIRTADKYEIDRERFVKICLMALIATADTISYNTYRSEEGE